MNVHALLLTALLALMAHEGSGQFVTGGAALAVGLAAVLGLKIAGLAAFAVARSAGGRGRGRGGRGRGRSYGRGRRGHGRRGRRDLVSEDGALELAQDQEETYFELIERADTLGCGLRVVCELETREHDQLQADEKLILALFGSQPTPPSYRQLTDSASGQYQLAAFLGAEKKDVKRCGQLFSRCPYSSEQLMQALRTADAQQ